MLVSATLWMASASIDDAPVKTKATNLAMASPRLAKRAARIAFVPPLAAMGGKANGLPARLTWPAHGAGSASAVVGMIAIGESGQGR